MVQVTAWVAAVHAAGQIILDYVRSSGVPRPRSCEGCSWGFKLELDIVPEPVLKEMREREKSYFTSSSPTACDPAKDKGQNSESQPRCIKIHHRARFHRAKFHRARFTEPDFTEPDSSKRSAIATIGTSPGIVRNPSCMGAAQPCLDLAWVKRCWAGRHVGPVAGVGARDQHAALVGS
jgi:hypothetical protein